MTTNANVPFEVIDLQGNLDALDKWYRDELLEIRIELDELIKLKAKLQAGNNAALPAQEVIETYKRDMRAFCLKFKIPKLAVKSMIFAKINEIKYQMERAEPVVLPAKPLKELLDNHEKFCAIWRDGYYRMIKRRDCSLNYLIENAMYPIIWKVASTTQARKWQKVFAQSWTIKAHRAKKTFKDKMGIVVMPKIVSWEPQTPPD